MKLLLATNNKHKVDEIKAIIRLELGSEVTVLTPSELGIDIEVPENEETLEGNALTKAKAFFEKSGICSIADDTGLEINSLHGRPGVRSARFAGEPANDFENRKLVLSLMEGIKEQKRSARFRTVICYFDARMSKLIDGSCEGRITTAEKGEQGFGYDSIFIPDGYDKTFAEMDSSEKNSISHRSKAINNFVRWLKTYK